MSTLLVDIHTMFLHMGSLSVSIYLLAKEVDLSWNSFRGAFTVFLIFASVAEVLNITIFQSGILNGQTFNMFYISPYFISSLPVFNSIQRSVPFPIFIMIYLFAIFLGSGIVFFVASCVKMFVSRKVIPYDKGQFPHES